MSKVELSATSTSIEQVFAAIDRPDMCPRVGRIGDVDAGALFSDCGRYRYLLARIWDPTLPRAFFCGTNPSFADHERNDTTASKYIGFCRRWNFGGYWAGNLQPTIETDLSKAQSIPLPPNDPEENDYAIALALTDVRIERVVCAWGDPPKRARAFLNNRAEDMKSKMLARFGVLSCLGRTAAGNPKHLSRLAYETPSEILRARTAAEREVSR